MQIICKDGTTIQCRDFEAIDSGVLFYQKSTVHGGETGEEDEEEEEEMETGADGFVPITELHFVLPDEMVQQVPGQRAGTAQQGRTAQQPPGTPTQQGGMAQQQQMQQPPGSPGQPNR